MTDGAMNFKLACVLAVFMGAPSVVGNALAQPFDAQLFDNVEIVVGVQDVPAIGGPAVNHARQWEKLTGGKVRVVRYPYGNLFTKFKDGIAADPAAFDVIIYASAWVGDFYQHLSPLPSQVYQDETFDDVHPTYRERLMTWDGEWIAVTVDGDLFSGYYRRDLFADPGNRSDFEKRYGYELGAPQTWAEYRDIAEFFTGRTGPDGRTLWGASEAFARNGQQFWDVFSRASAYVNHPSNPGCQFFDPETMKAQVDNPGWIRAVKEYVEILKFNPPGAISHDIVKVRDVFVGGRAALSLDWGDTAQIAADTRVSKVKDKVGYFVLPGTREMWNIRTGRWDKLPFVHKAPFLAFGGWVASVPKTSRNKDAAWNYIMWYSSPENSLSDVVTSGSGINPYRYSHFSAIDKWTEAFSARAASEFLNVLKDSLDSPHVAMDLRIPGFNDYTEAFEIELTKALKGETTVEDAMARVADQWEGITDRHGREKQRAIYRSSMGLAN